MATPSREKALRAQLDYRRSREREARVARLLGWENRRLLPAFVLTLVLMCGGVAWFTVAPSTLSYWLGATLAALPFLWFVCGVAVAQGWEGGPPDPAQDFSGPFGPP
jgi:hypothetical protein